LEPYAKKIEKYLKCLEIIADTDEGQRRERAWKLLNNYKLASLKVFKWRGRDLCDNYHSRLWVEPQRQCWGAGGLWDCLMFKSLWDY